jgi:hypothetical protein
MEEYLNRIRKRREALSRMQRASERWSVVDLFFLPKGGTVVIALAMALASGHSG